jgi:N-acetylneuraminic acid mutarotase
MKTTFSSILFLFLFSISCKKDAEILPKFYPYVVTVEPVVYEGGVIFSAEILQPGDQEIEQYGFVWSDKGNPSASSDCKLFRGNVKKGIYSFTLTGGLIKGTQYTVRAYVVSGKIRVLGNPVSFESSGSLPPQITSFTPTSGPIGTPVVIEGKNFAVSASENRVKFGNVQAIIDSVSEDRLFVTVPTVTESVFLPISVETAEMTDVSDDSFDIWFPWKRMKDFSDGLNNMTGFSIGDKAYLGLGYGTTDFWEYDPASDEFVQKSDFPVPIDACPRSFTINNRGYVIFSNGNNNDPGTSKITQLWEYNPAEDLWTRMADFPGHNRNSAVAFSIGSKGYFVSGIYYDEQGYTFFPRDFWEYDPSSNSWTQRKDFPVYERQLAFGFSIGTSGYVASGAFEKTLYRYDQDNNTWTYIGDYPGKGNMYINGFVIDNKCYLGMGYDGNSYSFADFWEFDPSGNSWKQMKSCPVGLEACLAFAIKNKGYIGIGFQHYMDNRDNRHIIYEFDPAKN